MALLIDGLLTHKLPWALVLFGVFIAIVLSLSGVEALAFAVGLYLPLVSSTPIWLAGSCAGPSSGGARRRARSGRRATPAAGPVRVGLIAGGTLCGLLTAGIAAGLGEDGLSVPRLLGLEGTQMAGILDSNWLSVVLFCLLAFALYRIGRRSDA